ncbi:MAG: acetyl-CoA carboxylase biotin carboxyl carrier protein [Helicobacteraceae bacterium]|nr:acetyl-CoA carboxylase biotin carboxyl carrier protein [Helicobacteraceae bacterium]
MDTKQIKALMREFDDSGLSRVKINKENGFSIELEKNVGVVAAPVVAAPIAVAAPAMAVTTSSETSTSSSISGDTVDSPMVGTYYSAPSPDSPDFVKVGQKVKKGETLAVLEAMKIMNDLEAEFDCTILEILVNDGQPVEYDMPLFVVEKA